METCLVCLEIKQSQGIVMTQKGINFSNDATESAKIPAWSLKCEATFIPIVTDNLRFDAQKYIGQRFFWRGQWYIEDGSYKGQVAWMVDFLKHPEVKIGWVPDCDLSEKVIKEIL